MKRNTSKGFTLVELLVTIILLGIIGAIVVYNMMNVSSSSKEADYEKFIAKVKAAAQTYATINPEPFKDLYINKAYLYITMEDLIHAGYVDENLKNPYTEEKVKANELIKANLNTTNGALTFEYPVTSNEEENFLVAMSDYVVYGEPYDCMQGAGTYQLALSEENGDLILLNSQSVIDEYNFTCEYPSEFKTYDNSYPESYRKGKYTDKPGTYTITYNWITKSGTPKSQTRTLRVLSKVKPTFTIREVVNGNSNLYDYKFDSKSYYTPSYTRENGWKYLTYTPFVEGSDPETTTFSVKKIALDQYNEGDVPVSGAKEEIVTTNSHDYTTAYPVDDGVKRYTINTTVYGHYNKSYSYNADNSVIMRSKLIIPDEYLEVDGSNWVTDRTITIKNGVYSPVGIAYYEYRLANSTPTSTLSIETDYTFNKQYNTYASTYVPFFNNNRVNVDVAKVISLLAGNSCEDSRIEYLNVYVRAINDDKYVGDWKVVRVNLTSDLQKLLIQDNNCNKTSANQCYYIEKKAYIDYAGFKFVVLENYGDGRILVTKDGVMPYVTPIDIKKGRIEIASCDMMVYANINYRSPVVERIIKGVEMAIPNVEKHAVYNSWNINSMYVTETSKGTSFGNTVEYIVKENTTPYTAFFGSATVEHLNKYKNAMLESSRYWTTDMFNKEENTTAVGLDGSHQTNTSYYNVYLYYIENGEKRDTYVGDTLPVKPMVVFNNLNVCATEKDVYGNITYKIALN